jgi:hypothetical protein
VLEALFCIIKVLTERSEQGRPERRADCDGNGIESCRVQAFDLAKRSEGCHNVIHAQRLRFHLVNGIGVAFSTPQRSTPTKSERSMDLAIWIPAMVVLGLVTMALMFAFVVGCDKV